MSKICKKRVHGNEKNNLPWAFNTLTTYDEHSRRNREESFSQNFIAFLESTLNLEHFEKKKEKKEPYSSSISEVIDSERLAYLNA